MLKKLTEEEKKMTLELTRLEKASAVEEMEMSTFTELCDKGKAGCEEAETEAEGIKVGI